MPLTFSLNLETRARVGHVYESLAPEALLALMTEWGWVGNVDTTHGGTPFVQTQIGPMPLGLYCLDPSDQVPGEYRCVVLRTYVDVPKGDAAKAAQELNQRLVGVRAHVDEDGDLVLETEIFLQGGVTAEHAKQRIEWFTAVLQGA